MGERGFELFHHQQQSEIYWLCDPSLPRASCVPEPNDLRVKTRLLAAAAATKASSFRSCQPTESKERDTLFQNWFFESKITSFSAHFAGGFATTLASASYHVQSLSFLPSKLTTNFKIKFGYQASSLSWQNVSVNTSIITLIAIALDRYNAILYPFSKKSSKRETKASTRCVELTSYFLKTRLVSSRIGPLGRVWSRPEVAAASLSSSAAAVKLAFVAFEPEGVDKGVNMKRTIQPPSSSQREADTQWALGSRLGEQTALVKHLLRNLAKGGQ